MFLLGIFIFLSKKSWINFVGSITYYCCAIWFFGYFMLFSTANPTTTFWSRFVYVGVVFIAPGFFHFSVTLLKLDNQRKYVPLAYLISLFFLCLDLFTDYFVIGLYKYFWGYYTKINPFIHNLFLLYFSVLYGIGILNLVKAYRKQSSSPMEATRLKYLIWSYAISIFGAVDFIPKYGYEVYPFGYIPTGLAITIIAYAIVRYRLMDITVAVTRTGIFVMVYTLILGLPFAIAARYKPFLVDLLKGNWWTLPLGLMAFLATIGPYIYIYLDRKAEARLLKEQRRYQDTLKQASIGMTRIRNLRRLLELIAHIITKTVRISYVAIYIHDERKDEYVLQVSRDKGRIPIPSVTSKNLLVAWIMENREIIVYEEIKRRMQDSNDSALTAVEENMRLLTAAVIIPSFLKDHFIGFIVLGDKLSGNIYTSEDLDVFQVLASQAALAIENAQVYEEAKEMQEQIAQAEKMATIGTMADGLSHQINNRLYALSLIAGDTIDTIKTTDTSQCTDEIKEMVKQISHSLERIQANVMQGGEVVKGLLKYSRKGDSGYEALGLGTILDNTLEMVQFKVKLSELDIIRNFDANTPKVKGNLTQLEEVFFNLIDNAYDAIVERRTTLKEEGYRGKITVSGTQKGNNLEIIVEDNGMGVKDDNNKSLFTPFFTTKTSSRRGTGLGLYVIKRIISEIHGGTIAFESQHKVGTRFIIELAIAKD